MESPADYDYLLPPGLIAQTPVEPRDASRLMVVHRDSGRIEHRTFRDILDYVRPGDVLVLNDSRVRPARLFARKDTGGRVELLVLRPGPDGTWEALVSPGRRVPPGVRLVLDDGTEADVVARTESGGRLIRFRGDVSLDETLDRLGEVPLPPYIHERLDDPERYQTVYSAATGSAAAPTAGLHFTPGLMEDIRAAGAAFATVTLHIGLDTFRPVKVDNLAEHVMHSEWFEVPEETASAVNAAGHVVAVGTTSVRALESAAAEGGVRAGARDTRLFLRPGSPFQVVDALITNFHLPRSTLLMLVSAFAGKELVFEAYREAVKEGYRFFSFGDAMLIA